MLKHLGLLLDGKIVLGIDHRFTLSNPALVSAPSTDPAHMVCNISKCLFV